jgi:hypothetical protein
MPNRKGTINRPNTCATGPKAIKRQERIAEALRLRRQGLDIRGIGKELGCSHGTAANYVNAAMQGIVSKEKAAEVFAIEVQRLDALHARYWPDAMDGDLAAAKLCKDIIHQRSQLHGLYPQGGGGFHVNIANNSVGRIVNIAAEARDSDDNTITVRPVTPDPASGSWRPQWRLQLQHRRAHCQHPHDTGPSADRLQSTPRMRMPSARCMRRAPHEQRNSGRLISVSRQAPLMAGPQPNSPQPIGNSSGHRHYHSVRKRSLMAGWLKALPVITGA